MDDFQKLTWIQGDDCCEAPQFRRIFQAGKGARALISICGLGFFELYLNGKRVSEDRFVPAWSNYEERDLSTLLYPIHDTFTKYRTYYREYDLTGYLKEGENVLGILLGNGWYHQNQRNVEGKLDYGFPKLAFELTLTEENGEIKKIESDETVKWTESEITANNIFYGETVDLRRRQEGWKEAGFDDSAWKTAVKTAAPKTEFFLQDCPPDKIIRTLHPTLVLQEKDRAIYDAGENISGVVSLHLLGEEGELVEVFHSEELNCGKTALDFTSCGGENQIQKDSYFCSGQEETVFPRFCWHGFRYFEVRGKARPEAVLVIHTDVEVISEFECSDPVLNWLYKAYVRTQLDNIHCSVPSDCPHRERLGYGGDGQLCAKAAMLCLDGRTVYPKWLRDIVDCQDKKNGHVQHTSPFYGGGGGPGGWGSCIFVVPQLYYEIYGKDELLSHYYPNMRLWLSYMHSRSENGLIVREEKDGWCLGDWCVPGGVKIPEAFVNTYYYIKGLRTVIAAGERISATQQGDLEILRSRLQESEEALCRTYFDPMTGSFCEGVNGADAFAVDLGLGDERTLKGLVKKYSEHIAFDTGIFGTALLIEVLFERGEGELAYRLLTEKTETSFVRMMEAGATTLWEYWDGQESHNHPMFGGLLHTFFTYLLGIRQEPGTVGYTQVKIDPVAIPGLNWVKGSLKTVAGKISVSYEKEPDGSLKIHSRIDPEQKLR